jgi:hypothetical protein
VEFFAEHRAKPAGYPIFPTHAAAHHATRNTRFPIDAETPAGARNVDRTHTFQLRAGASLQALPISSMRIESVQSSCPHWEIFSESSR